MTRWKRVMVSERSESNRGSRRVSASVKGIEQFLANLRRVGVKASGMRKTIGHNTDYAAAVHENLSAEHAVGQAKFLETAMRKNQAKLAPFIAARVKRAVEAGGNAQAAALRALDRFGEQVIGDSQKLTPVLTGALQASGTTEPAKVNG